MPKWADAFVNSIGVNTHFAYGGTAYTSGYSTLSADLVAMHIRHIRDDVGIEGSPYNSQLASLAASGVHVDYIADYGEPVSSIVSAIAALKPAVEYVEYPNEWDANGGSNWQSTEESYGATLYAGKSQFGVPVIGPSFASATSVLDFAAGTFRNMADTGNIHDYMSTYNPENTGYGGTFPPCAGSYGTIQFWMSCSQNAEPSVTYSTETGYQDNDTYSGVSGALSDAVKARYTMRLLLAQFNAGIPLTYLYELVDESGMNYGLISGSLVQKPVFFGIQGLTTNLADPGSAPTLTPLAYTMSGASSIDHTLLEKRTGEYHLLLWEPVAATSGTPSQTVNLTFATKPTSITQNVWQDSGKVVSTSLTPSTSISLSVTDRVTDIVLN